MCVCARADCLYQIEAVSIAAAAYLCHQSSDVITYHQRGEQGENKALRALLERTTRVEAVGVKTD